jgi:hypothetical protein
VIANLGHDPEKACPGLDPGWIPGFGKDHAALSGPNSKIAAQREMVAVRGRVRSISPHWITSPPNKETTLPEQHSKERSQAEARFKKAQKAVHDAKEARAHYESEARAVREKTAKLKALRLAKEAADAAEAAEKKPVTSKATPSV